MIQRYIIYLLLMLVCIVTTAQAQGQTLYGIGYTAGQKTVTQGKTKVIYDVSSGAQTGARGSFKEIVQDQVMVLSGMPLNVSYFPVVFGEDLFVSKGYFSGYVQLQWNIKALNSRISKFYIYRKPLGQEGDSSLVATTAGDVYAWRDEQADKGVLYKYTVFAKGISDNVRLPFVNYVESTGFVTATGTAAGRITYEGGTAVAGVNVVAETTGDLSGKSIYLPGTDAYLALEHKDSDTELELSTGFAIQAWYRYEGSGRGALFSKGSGYELTYEPGALSFTVGGRTSTMAYTAPQGEFFHVTAVYSPGKDLRLYVHVNADQVDSLVTAAGTTPAANYDNIWFGRNQADQYFKGYMDEIRLWKHALTYAEIKRDFNRYLTGSEDGLVGYWNLNAGVGDRFYDLSRKGYSFYENHGYVWRAEWSEITPKPDQLAYRGVTDAQGNYSIVGFPYQTEGSLYTFTPMYHVHKFEPAQALRYVGDGASVHNGLDFKDVSSFSVTGTVRYRHSNFPVEGVSLLIDGQPVTTKEGTLVVTDNLGRFTIDVPIGPHNIRISKSQHGFMNDGRFPPEEEDGTLPLFDFQAPLSGLEFTDTSLVKIIGRVAGGPVQEEIPVGFGRSTNNLGTAKIYITSEKGYDITTSDSTLLYDERFISSSTSFSTKFAEVSPDISTGEFVAYLPPERYRITAVTAGNYTFDESFNKTINLENNVEDTESITDTLAANKNGVALPGYPPYDPADYDEISTESKDGVVYTLGKLNCSYQSKQNFILRLSPTITVTNDKGATLFGENKYTYEDLNLNVSQDIPLINQGAYTFGFPVFVQRNEYQMVVDVFEEYIHGSTGAVDRVPVVDGEIEIVNNLAIQTDKVTLEINDNGRAVYSFRAGLPEINQDAINPENSYTNTISVAAITGNGGALRTIWRENDPFRAYVFGAMPIGNNFVTTGPTEVTTILRDPAGSGSSASFEAGSSVSQSRSWGSSVSLSEEINATVSLGVTVTTFTGVGAGTINEGGSEYDIDTGISTEQVWTEEGESIITTEATKTISTSGETDYVGADGDVFVGYATNIVYGSALNLMPLPKNSCSGCTPEGVQEYGGFKLGLKNTLRLNPEFSTFFIYTQAYIEGTLIPNLERLRNNYLIYSGMPDTLQTGDRPVYIARVSSDHENFGSNNDDEDVWGTAISENRQDGPSYLVKIPQLIKDQGTFVDSVRYFNSQIEEWKYWLGENERRKVQAKLIENISFDAGTTYESSKTVSTTTSSTRTFEFSIQESAGVTTGFEINKSSGVEGSISLGTSQADNSSDGSENSAYTTYSYTLADGDAGDYMSIDVKDAGDGFGPVFYLRAGATSCPYEGDVETKYYKPGTLLGDATLAREKVAISVAQALVSNIPENRAGEFTIVMANNSETKEDAWYDLKVDDTTNPYGAVLAVDGQPIANGRSFFIPAGSTLQKIVKVSKGSSSVLDYPDLGLVLSSPCDGNVSDTVHLSAYFQPGCSDISISTPKDQWVLNSNTRPEDSLSVVIQNYDLNFGNFKYVLFQYKPSATSQWTTERVFYNSKQVTQEEYDQANDPKSWIYDTKIQYAFDMHSLPNRTYDIRAVSVCVLGPGVEVETPTDILHGTKDVKRPVVFGSPQPGDGILEAGDEISIQFDETIEAGLLTPFNFSVKGVLNNYKLDHNTSVTLDGVNDYIKVPDGLSLSKSFTVEFWLKRNATGREGVVLSKGYTAQDAIQMGFSATNKVFVEAAGQRIESVNSFTETDWHHYAISYNEESRKISVYRDDAYVIDQVQVTSDISGQGPMLAGMSVAADRYVDVNLHELRAWSAFQTLSQVYAKLYTPLNGDEIGLVGYWPLDEAYGERATDKARARHALVSGDWLVLPRGKAMRFNGSSDYAELSTASTVVISDQMDMTLEFYFKGAAGQTNTTLFSSGKGDGTDHFNAGNVSVNVNGEGKLQVLSNGQELLVSDDEVLMDDNWHHFALVLQRNANTTLYIDGEQKATRSSENMGGMSGVVMWGGARGYKESALSTVHDQFFRGQLDELRIWRLARTQDQLVMDRNAKLKGDEAGLVAYYPFEYYETVMGVKLMKQTLADQWQNPYGTNGGTAVVSGAIFSDDAPNLRDARPVTSVDFDWATNDDKIIITPSSALAGVMEKTVLEITVSDVEDLFENRLASPVTWTAYVDRNPLKWDNDNLEFEKKLYDAMHFTVNIVNRGGTQQHYTIKNLPLWLTADAETGVVEPLASVAVTFTVNEGLNTGYFSEDIFLTGDFGFDEKLHLDLRVYTPDPGWKVDPAKYQYSMNVIGQLKIQGIISTDVNDQVAAFVNNECRGVTSLRYIKEFDMYQAYLDIYSNRESGEVIELRVWDASRGTEHRDVSPDYIFLSNALKGTPSVPEIIEAGATIVKTMNMEAGWNWTSFNLVSAELTNVNSLLDTLDLETGDQLKGQRTVDVYTEDIGWTGTLSSTGGLQNGAMYMMKFQHAGSFEVKGIPVDPSYSIAIRAGWNWIGVNPQFNITLDEALASLNSVNGDLVKGKRSFAIYQQGLGWIGSLTYLVPGEGYLLRTAKEGALVYPKTTSLSAERIKQNQDKTPYWPVDVHKMQSNMSVVAKIESNIMSKLVVGAFAGDVCLGFATPTKVDDDHTFYFLTIQGEGSENITFKAMNMENGEIIALTEHTAFTVDAVIGTFNDPYLLTLGTDGIDTGEAASQLVYPNPFSDHITITLPDANGEYLLTLTDLTGHVVKQQRVTGIDSVEWKQEGATALPPGVYFLTIDGGINRWTIKVVRN